MQLDQINKNTWILVILVVAIPANKALTVSLKSNVVLASELGATLHSINDYNSRSKCLLAQE